jgi:Domain of unknown function (DUF4184)
MPWTVSHVTAVLPLRRCSPRPFDFAALVGGSMASDLGYYIGRFDLATFAHTLAGSFVVGLPSAAIFLLGLYVFCKPVCYLLPRPHRPALLRICPSFDRLRPARWPVILLSLLLGVWTHNFWDAWTHDTGWFAQRISWLGGTVVHVGSATFTLPFVLQVLSTFVGAGIVATAYFLWLRRQPRDQTAEAESDGWRYLLGFGICAVALLIAVPAAWHFAGSRQGVLFARAVMFRVAIYAPAIVIPLGLVAASVMYRWRSRAA